jgi:malonate transporter and related proteins
MVICQPSWPLAVAIKLVVYPALALMLMSLFGPFSDVWVHTAVLMAALPPALNVFVLARQYTEWLEQASSSEGTSPASAGSMTVA